MTAPFIAVDWGTTNRRAYRIEGGVVAATVRDDRGVSAMAGRDFAAEVTGLRDRLGDLPVLMAGMIGSTIGWREAPYATAPADLAALAAACLGIDDRTAIVPGVAVMGTRPDVMRGEEVQLLGAVAAGLAPADALLCQPGTHCKWARMERGAIAGFTTAMTGELFALLRGQSILARQLAGPVVDGAAFRRGVTAGAERDLAATLFGIRAGAVLGALADGDAPAYASGALIGADVAARLAEHDGSTVHVLAEPTLGILYRTAIETLGGRAATIDAEPAFVAGITAIQERRA